MYKNTHEQRCFEVLQNIIPNLFVFQCDNSNLSIVEKRIKYYGNVSPLLFKEAGTGIMNLAVKGHEIRKEFLLYFPVIQKKIWIEVKYLSKCTSLRDVIYGEINRLRNYEGNLILLLLGDGFDKGTIQTYQDEVEEKNLVNRIKIVTNYSDLKDLIEFEQFSLVA